METTQAVKKERTCRERIGKHLESREQDAEEMFKKIDSEDSELNEEGYEELDSLPIHISKKIEIKIELSYGGPSDFLIAMVDPEDNQIDSLEYHFQDWFDGAKEQIDEDSPLWRLAEYYMEGMAG